MRKLMWAMLLATGVAMPAMAQEVDGDRDRRERASSSEQRQARRAAREERMTRERPQDVGRIDWSERREVRRSEHRAESDVPVARRRAFEHGDRRRWGERRSNHDGLVAALERRQAAEEARGLVEPVSPPRDVRRDRRGRDGTTIGRAIEEHGRRDGQFVPRRESDDRVGSRYASSERRWNHHWRGDRSYDWRRHRDRHRSIFRRGHYWDPYGDRYRRFTIGFSLWPSYYRSDYWLHDPWMYRLPRTYGPYRWVRYYDDALLVNIYTGQVVDVVHSFFW